MVEKRTALIIAIIVILIGGGLSYYFFLMPRKPRADVIIWEDFLPAEEELTRQFIENSFRQLYPNITVELVGVPDLRTRLLAALPAGKGPDLFMWAHDWTGEFAEAGFILPLDEFVTEDLKGKFLETAINACMYNGHIYALPFAAETVALVYNKEMVPNPPQNMSQLESIMQQYVMQGKYGIAYQVDPYFVSAWPHAFGGYYFRDEDKSVGVNNTETVEGIKYFMEHIKPYMSTGDTSREAQVAIFVDQKAPFLVDGPWGIGTLKQANLSIGVTLLPKIDEIDEWPRPYTGIKVVWMSSNVHDKEKAFTFMKWFVTNAEYIKQRALQLGFIPVLKEVLNDPEVQADEIVSAYAKQVELGIPMPKSKEMMKVWGPVGDAISEIFLEIKTADEALDEAQRRILESLAGG